jgi:phage head maturation protease
MARDLRVPTEDEYRSHGAPPFGHVRAIGFEPLGLDEASHAVEGLVSTDQWARDGQRILPTAWARNLPVYQANPIVTFAHSWWEIPIGLAAEVRIEANGLWARLEFDVEDELAARVWQAIMSRRLRTTSVAWDGQPAGNWNPRLGDANEFGEWVEGPDGNPGFEWRDNLTLMEISVVPIPADTGAVFGMARGMGLAPVRMLGSADEAEEARAMEHLKRLTGAAEGLRNWTRHIAKGGGAPSPAVIEQALNPISDLLEIATGGQAREGKVLSAANKAKVKAALEALQELYAGAGGEEADGGPDDAERHAAPPIERGLWAARQTSQRAAEASREEGLWHGAGTE